MSDGEVSEAEREDMWFAFQEAGLDADDVREVFSEFLEKMQKDLLVDGQVTEAERKRCQALIDQLRIPLRLLPPDLLAVVLGKH